MSNRLNFGKTRLLTGFTIAEIVTVVAIIALVTLVAVPNFMKLYSDNQKSTCVNNLRAIQLAKEQWGLENNKVVGDVPTAADIDSYLKENIWDETASSYTIGHNLVCPCDTNANPTFGTSYTINPLGTDSICNIYANHRL
ncbi:MAG: prepilin-type cleavage/methylation domain-containing protein [Candidatus Omnitrophica bacterium]|nr:prepilin-type cleavage/methylation domain-containing protein [Candidatus Omnitrophota bacterium]